MVVAPLYLAVIGKSRGAIHSLDNGMVFWLLESPGNCTKDQSQSISMKCRVQWTSAGHHHSHVLQNCSWYLTDLTLRFWAAVLFKTLSDSAWPYGKNLSDKISQFQGHNKYPLGQGLQDETIRLTGHSILPTDTSHVTQRMDPNKAAWPCRAAAEALQTRNKQQSGRVGQNCQPNQGTLQAAWLRVLPRIFSKKHLINISANIL